jgi:hypothetical protein
MPERAVDYVFGYGSLVSMSEPVSVDGLTCHPQAGRLDGFHRTWGAAMNNWEATELEKHFIDPTTGEKPRIRVAYLDIEERPGSAVNGLAIPVDARRLAELDVREVNYVRVDVTPRFEPPLGGRVFAYAGTAEARERAHPGRAGPAIYVSRDYVVAIRGAFAAMGGEALAEYDRTTDPLPFPERHLTLRYPPAETDASN